MLTNNYRGGISLNIVTSYLLPESFIYKKVNCHLIDCVKLYVANHFYQNVCEY